MKEIKIKLPFLPISVNTAYAGYKIRHKSDAYIIFLRQLDDFFLTYDWERILDFDWFLEVEYKLFCNIYTKEWKIKKMDVANYEKVLSDWLANYIHWFQDEKIKKITMEKIQSDEHYTEITIKKYE